MDSLTLFAQQYNQLVNKYVINFCDQFLKLYYEYIEKNYEVDEIRQIHQLGMISHCIEALSCCHATFILNQQFVSYEDLSLDEVFWTLTEIPEKLVTSAIECVDCNYSNKQQLIAYIQQNNKNGFVELFTEYSHSDKFKQMLFTYHSFFYNIREMIEDDTGGTFDYYYSILAYHGERKMIDVMSGMEESMKESMKDYWNASILILDPDNYSFQNLSKIEDGFLTFIGYSFLLHFTPADLNAMKHIYNSFKGLFGGKALAHTLQYLADVNPTISELLNNYCQDIPTEKITLTELNRKFQALYKQYCPNWYAQYGEEYYRVLFNEIQENSQKDNLTPTDGITGSAMQEPTEKCPPHMPPTNYTKDVLAKIYQAVKGYMETNENDFIYYFGGYVAKAEKPYIEWKTDENECYHFLKVIYCGLAKKDHIDISSNLPKNVLGYAREIFVDAKRKKLKSLGKAKQNIETSTDMDKLLLPYIHRYRY